MAMVPSGQFFWSPLSMLDAKEHTHGDKPPRYNPKSRSAGRDTGLGHHTSFFTTSPWEDHLLSERLGVGLLGSHPSPHGSCQGRQERALLQPAGP
jgi:hypothetical protein